MNTSSEIYCSYLERSRIDLQVEEANVYVARALRYVIENVLAQLSATLVVTISTRDEGTARWFEYVMNTLVYSWRVAAVQLLRFSTDIERLRVRVPGRKRFNLLLVDSYEGLLNSNITEDNADFDDPEYYFIFLQTRDHLIPMELRLILDHCLEHYWLHCNVMVQTAQVDVLVYSYFPYTSEHCQAAQPVQVNHFDGQRMVNATMFPEKLHQLHGCPISVLTWNQPPFVELTWAEGRLRASGFEFQLVEHLARLLNFTVQLFNLTILPPEHYRLANGTREGPIEWARDHLLQQEMRQIFEYCWRYHLIHCSVQVQKSNGDVLIYSYYPYSVRSCADMSPRLINRYNGSVLLEPEIFPRKLRNLFGCPLRCALWNVPPFVAVRSQSESKSDSESSISGGYEGRLLLTLAERMNFSIAVRQLQAKNMRDEALELLRRHEADLTLGGIRQTVDRSQQATSTHNYHQTREVFGILDSSFELSSLDILFYPYRLQIWLAIAGVLALSALLQLAIERLLRETRPESRLWLNLELIFVGMPLLVAPRSHTGRLYCLLLMLYTLIIRTVYQGLLYHLIRTHQLNRWPQSIDALVQQNYTVVVTPLVHEVLSEIPSVEHMTFRILPDGGEMAALEYLVANAEKSRHVSASALEMYIHFNRLSEERARRLGQRTGQPVVADHFEIIAEDIVSMQMTMYLSKHSFLIDHLNDEIMWMRATGLVAVWARWELVDSYLRNEQGFKQLGLVELYAMFLLVVLGHLLSLLIFLLELLSQRLVRLQRLFL